MSVLTIGPVVATALAATVDNPRSFASGRHFSAWIGLVPKQRSTGGKERLGGISKRGDTYLRKLLIHGARAAVHRVRSHQSPGAWIAGLLTRRHFNIATVALANKTARIAWAVMVNGSSYAQRHKLTLRFILGSTRANKVVMTTGRTGIGKTRWLYRAANARQGKLGADPRTSSRPAAHAVSKAG
jgi:hypothetical protein